MPSHTTCLRLCIALLLSCSTVYAISSSSHSSSSGNVLTVDTDESIDTPTKTRDRAKQDLFDEIKKIVVDIPSRTGGAITGGLVIHELKGFTSLDETVYNTMDFPGIKLFHSLPENVQSKLHEAFGRFVIATSRIADIENQYPYYSPGQSTFRGSASTRVSTQGYYEDYNDEKSEHSLPESGSWGDDFVPLADTAVNDKRYTSSLVDLVASSKRGDSESNDELHEMIGDSMAIVGTVRSCSHVATTPSTDICPAYGRDWFPLIATLITKGALVVAFAAIMILANDDVGIGGNPRDNPHMWETLGVGALESALGLVLCGCGYADGPRLLTLDHGAPDYVTPSQLDIESGINHGSTHSSVGAPDYVTDSQLDIESGINHGSTHSSVSDITDSLASNIE